MATKKAATKRLKKTNGEKPLSKEVLDRAAKIAKTAGKRGKGATEIRSDLGLSDSEFARGVRLALQQGKLRKEGATRMTRYFSV